MEEHREAAQRKIGIMLTYANIAIMILITIVYTPIMLNRLGASEYGIYTMATALIGYLAMLDLGLGSTLVKFSSKYRVQGEDEMEARLRGVFLLIYSFLGLIALIVGLVVFSQLGEIFGEGLTRYELSRLKVVFLIMTVNLAISFPLKVFGSIVISYERFVVMRGLELLKTILSRAAMMLILLIGGKSILLSLTVAVFSVSIDLTILYYACFRMKIRIKLGTLDQGVIGEICYFSFFIFLNLVIDQLYQNTSRVLLGALCGTLAVTTYNVGMQFHSLLIRLSAAVSGVYLPYITEIVTKGTRKGELLSRQFITIGRFQFVVLSLFVSGFFCFGKSFIRLWAGAAYEEAYQIALIVMIPAMIPLTQNLGILILQAENKHAFRSIAYFCLALLNVVVGVPLVQRWGGSGAAVAMALSCLLGQVLTMNVYYARAIGINIRGYWREIGKIISVALPASLIGAALQLVIPMRTWPVLILVMLAYVLFYLIIAWYLILNAKERMQVLVLVRRLRRCK